MKLIHTQELYVTVKGPAVMLDSTVEDFLLGTGQAILTAHWWIKILGNDKETFVIKRKIYGSINGQVLHH